jgi:hypothetical protein
MLKGCLVYSSMRLGVPFISPRQLGVVESNSGKQFLPSVAWRTGQSGAPPDTVRCGSLSLFGEADRWRLGAVRAPDSSVPPSSRWLGHVSRADRATDRWPGRPLAHRTVRCTPDSRAPAPAWRTAPCRVHHRTVRCTQTKLALAKQGRLFSNSISLVSST